MEKIIDSLEKLLRRFYIVRAVMVMLILVIFLIGPASPTHAVVSAGNGIYNVHVEDTSGGNVGVYTATTGPAHPAGNGLSVLFGSGSPGTTFNTIRSYTSNTDYIQGLGKTSVNSTVWLDSFGTVTPLGTTGFRTTYSRPPHHTRYADDYPGCKCQWQRIDRLYN